MTEELDIGKLYEQHGPFIVRSIERLTGDGEHVDDLLQETFVVAFRKRHTYERDRAASSTWLYGIAANLCRRHHRSARRLARFKTRFLLEQNETPQSQPDQHLERRQLARIVREVLQKLPFKQRELFSLYELENMNGNTIATMLGIPVSTVWTRLHHARRRFTKLMEARLGKARPA